MKSHVTRTHVTLTHQVRAIGMGSPELLQLVEGCPPGGETLIMRMLHILTESGKWQEDKRATHTSYLHHRSVSTKVFEPSYSLPELPLQKYDLRD